MTILFYLFVFADCWQVITWVGVLGSTARKGTETKENYAPPVSIIVCFRNEAARLKAHLPQLLAQKYSDFEVIAVDDWSTDESATIVAKLALKDTRLRLVKPPFPTRPGKKDALTYGIQQAQHELLLLTDADCAPATKHWMTRMIAPFRNETTELVLGYSPYRQTDGSVNAFQRYETVYTALQYFGAAAAGMPYMGVGRNLAYRRSFFERAGGLEGHAHLAGGDDDLLISRHATATGTSTCVHPDAWVYSDPAQSWRDYLSRKYRHLGVGGHYPMLPKLFLGALAMSHLGVYVLGLFLVCASTYAPWVIVLLMTRWLIVVLVVKNSPFERLSAFAVLRGDVLMALYYLMMAPAPWVGKGVKGGW